MSVVKAVDENYPSERDFRNLIKYAIKPGHCICGLYGTQGLLKADGDTMADDMLSIKRQYGKLENRMALHYVVSFSQEEMRYIPPYTALMIGYEVAAFFTDCQVVFGVHDNEENLHIHFMVNTTSYEDGKQYGLGDRGLHLLKDMVENIVGRYGFVQKDTVGMTDETVNAWEPV